MITVLIWNAEKVGSDTYQGLLAKEKKDLCSWSSTIDTNTEATLLELLAAVYAETDRDLEYRILTDDGIRVNYETDFHDHNCLTMYRTNDYDSYEAAHKDGATYSTPSTIDQLSIGGSPCIGLDIGEIIDICSQCIGGSELKAGILNKFGEFVPVPFQLEN